MLEISCDSLAVQIPWTSPIVSMVVVDGLRAPASLKRRTLFFVQRESLLEPAKSAALLFDRPRAGLLRHRGHVAQHAHAHLRGRVPLVTRSSIYDGTGRVRSLLQRRMRAGLDGSEVLALGGGRGDEAGEARRVKVVGRVVFGMAVADAPVHFGTMGGGRRPVAVGGLLRGGVARTL